MLFALASEMRPKPAFLAQQWVNEFNASKGSDVKFLLLPVTHPVLNPIELMWSLIKRHVRANNHEFTMESVEQLTKSKVAALDATAWKRSVQHSWKYATEQWRADEQILQSAEQAEIVAEEVEEESEEE